MLIEYIHPHLQEYLEQGLQRARQYLRVPYLNFENKFISQQFNPHFLYINKDNTIDCLKFDHHFWRRCKRNSIAIDVITCQTEWWETRTKPIQQGHLMRKESNILKVEVVKNKIKC